MIGSWKHHALIFCVALVGLAVQAAPLSAQHTPAWGRRLQTMLPALSASARPDAETYLAERDSLARVRAFFRVMRTAPKDTVAARFLRMASAADPSPWVRGNAVRELARVLSPDVAVDFLRHVAVADSSPWVRGSAVYELAKGQHIARDTGAFRTYWTAVTSDPSPLIRSQIYWMAHSGLPPAVVQDSLEPFVVRERDSTVVIQAIKAIRALSTTDRTILALLAKRLKLDSAAAGPRWIAAEHQRAHDAAKRYRLPWFMREPPPVFAAVPDTPSAIRFFAIGDWADGNNEHQQGMSAAVRAVHRRKPFTFGLTTGDNFYPSGLATPRSPRWAIEYERQYGVMGIPIYASLGNHDFYQSDAPAAEIAYTRYSETWKLPATHYTFTAGPAQFFVLDTESLTPWQLGWLDSALAASTAPWKIVVGHYDLYSDRMDGTNEKAKLLVPIFQRHQVPVYLNGHYHTLQHYQVDGTDYVTSGGGGRSLYAVDTTKVESSRKFAARSFGFAVIDVTPATFMLEFRDEAGKELYRYERRR